MSDDKASHTHPHTVCLDGLTHHNMGTHQPYRNLDRPSNLGATI